MGERDFGSQAEGAQKLDSPTMVVFNARRSKRIRAPRLCHKDQAILECSPTHHSYAWNKHKRGHTIKIAVVIRIYSELYNFEFYICEFVLCIPSYVYSFLVNLCRW